MEDIREQFRERLEENREKAQAKKEAERPGTPQAKRPARDDAAIQRAPIFGTRPSPGHGAPMEEPEIEVMRQTVRRIFSGQGPRRKLE